MKVLLLGAGMVAKPLADYILDNQIYLTIASRTIAKAEKLIRNRANGKALQWTIDDLTQLDQLIASHDLTVSLLPYAHHVTVAKLCIKHKKKHGYHIVCVGRNESFECPSERSRNYYSE